MRIRKGDYHLKARKRAEADNQAAVRLSVRALRRLRRLS